jgi:hypothetical protein
LGPSSSGDSGVPACGTSLGTAKPGREGLALPGVALPPGTEGGRPDCPAGPPGPVTGTGPGADWVSGFGSEKPGRGDSCLFAGGLALEDECVESEDNSGIVGNPVVLRVKPDFAGPLGWTRSAPADDDSSRTTEDSGFEVEERGRSASLSGECPEKGRSGEADGSPISIGLGLADRVPILQVELLFKVFELDIQLVAYANDICDLAARKINGAMAGIGEVLYAHIR